METKKETNIRCAPCGHRWFTKSTYKFVSCPSCMGKVFNPNYEEDKT